MTSRIPEMEGSTVWTGPVHIGIYRIFAVFDSGQGRHFEIGRLEKTVGVCERRVDADRALSSTNRFARQAELERGQVDPPLGFVRVRGFDGECPQSYRRAMEAS